MVAAGDLHIFGTIYGVFHIPSGNLLQFAIENGDLIIVDFSIDMCVYLPEGKSH